jgi:ribonuclease G
VEDDEPQVRPEATPQPATGPDGTEDGAPQGEADEGGAPMRRRRRGRRGGRRHRRKTDSATAPPSEVGDATSAETDAQVEAEGGAPAEEVAAPKRRRPRRRRADTAAAGTEAAAGGGTPAVEPKLDVARSQSPVEAGAKPAKAKNADDNMPKDKKKKKKTTKAKEATEPAKQPKAKKKKTKAKEATEPAKQPKPKKTKAEPAVALAAEPTPGPSPSRADARPERLPLALATGRQPESAEPTSAVVQGAAADEPAAPKRRTHRGGRGRRRKTADALAADVSGERAETTGQPTGRRPEAAVPAAAGRPGAPVAGEAVAGSAEGAGDEAAAAQEPVARRRRGHRGGRGRPKVAGEHPSPGHDSVERGSELSADAPVAGGVTAALEAAEEEQEEPARRSGRGRRGLARVEGGQADIPEQKQILVTVEGDELRVALVEDGRLAEIYIERPGKRSYAGNIYRGKVDNVIPGMDAAFVEIGLEKNGFLYVDEVAIEDEEARPRHITEVLKPRQELLVQVMKDPMGSKGARLTGQLSLAGRYLVYVPGGGGVGVSRRLGTAERDRLRELCKQLRPKKAGLIVRTVAEGKGLDELRRDMQYLSRLWSRLKARAEKVTAPGLVYEEADVSLQVARDLLNDTFEKVIVDDRKQRDKFVAYLKKEAPELADRVFAYEGERPLFEEHGIEEQIAKALDRRVQLPSGGNIVIDHAEALTVIDVNTGRYTAGRDLEETITKTNLEAAREVVRQLRLRDIGGIIIIDFIDMAYARNRDAVLAKLQAELDTDRTKTYVVEISPLGLVEMTRQNITDGARGILTKECPSCTGRARILSEDTSARNAVRAVRRQARASAEEAFLYEVNHGVAERIAAMGWLKTLEKETGKRVFFEGSQTLPVDTLRLIAAGTKRDVERQRVPVHEGQELEVELEHTLTYSPGDAVAHVDGYVLTILGGRPFLGKRRTVKVTAMTRTGAFATLVGKRRR